MKEVSVSDHPRAPASIARAKGRGGLLGFAVAAAASWMNGAVLFDVGLRGLIGGMAGYVLAWIVAVAVWRHLVRAEVKAAVLSAVEEHRRKEASKA